MANNTTLNVMTGGDVIADEDISGVKHQLVKLEYGLAGTATLVSATNPLPTYTEDATSITSNGPTAVTSAAADTLILAANNNRRGATIFNDSTATLNISLGTNAASATAFSVQLGSKGYFEVPFHYSGQIRGFWATANGFARVTEITP